MMKDDLPPLKTVLLIIAHSRGESAPQRIKPRSVVCTCAHDSNGLHPPIRLREPEFLLLPGNQGSLAITENEPTREAF
jgi:hypothetical protein